MKKLLTLAIIRDRDRVLLGLKKRGFGAGRWNGFGGKVQAGETVETAAARELHEEAGIEAEALEPVGILEFAFRDDPDTLEVHVFRVERYAGEPSESEEMRPQWFPADTLPFGEMWPDDRYWFPLFLAGKRFRGAFRFDDHDTIAAHSLIETDVLPRCAA